MFSDGVHCHIYKNVSKYESTNSIKYLKKQNIVHENGENFHRENLEPLVIFCKQQAKIILAFNFVALHEICCKLSKCKYKDFSGYS